MKIVLQDQNQLVAQDKAMGGLILGIVMVIVGVVLAASWLVTHTVASLLVGGVVVVVGGVVIVLHRERTLTINKAAGQVTVRVKSVLKNGEFPYPLSSVTKVQLVSSYQTTTTGTSTAGNRPGISIGTGGINMGGNTQTTQRTQLFLVMQDGTTIDLADGQRAMGALNMFSSVPNQKVGQDIAAFVGVPFETAGAPSMGQVIGAVENLIQGQSAAPSVVPGQPGASASAADVGSAPTTETPMSNENRPQ